MKQQLVIVAACALATACAEPPREAGAGLAVTVAPLSLPGVTNATYRLTVTNAAAQTVMTREVTSSAYGAGDGSLSYVAPCDADANDNTVTLELLRLDAASGQIPATDFDNPGPLARTFTCLPNADVPVTFDLTIARRATQGFFDVAVSFDDIFCSAKLDCLDAEGAPLRLLFNAAGARDTTVVLGFACTGGLDPALTTTLYRDDVTLTCDNGAVTLDPSAGPGNITYGAGLTGTAGLLFGAAVHHGDELIGVPKRYWNVLLGLTTAGHNCRVTHTATATSGTFPALTTPAGSTWPLVTWDVLVTGPTGALACTRHPLHGTGLAAGVATTYTDGTPPETFAHALPAAPVVPPTNVCEVGATTCPYTSCAHRQLAGTATTDGVYVIDPDGAGPLTAVEVFCDMTTDGGGWTVVARAFDVPYSPSPPAIGPGTSGTWAAWAAHSWKSGDSYYLSLDAFAALTASSPALAQVTRTSAGTVKRHARYASFRYAATTNTAWLGACTDVVSSPCSSAYAWGDRGANPSGFFDGHQQPGGGTTNCNTLYGTRIWNYHNWANCASDSGLFAFAGTTPRPADLGNYTASEHQNLIMVRTLPPASGTSCATILAGTPTAASGVYVIDPDGAGAITPMAVYCDMTPGNGGWTYGLIVNTNTSSANRTRLAGFTPFGFAATPSATTAYGVNLTGVTFSEVRIDNFTQATRVTRNATAPLTWSGPTYTTSTGYPAMKFDLAGTAQLRAGYYGGSGCGAVDTNVNIPVCFVTSGTSTSWGCDTDSAFAEGWLDCSGGEVCGGGFYYGRKVWRDTADATICRTYLGTTPPVVYGFAVR